MNNTQQFKKHLTSFKKKLRTLSLLLEKEEKNSLCPDKTVFAVVMPLVLANFFAAENITAENQFIIKEQSKKTLPANDNCLPQNLSLPIEKILPETASVIADLFAIKNRHILGDIYETLINNTAKKTAGQYYTPDFIVDYILAATLKNADIVQNPFVSVLDPACGCGHFLLKAYDMLKDKFRANLLPLRAAYANLNYEVTDSFGNISSLKGEVYWQEENIHYHILRHCLFGADTDENAALVTLAALMAKGSFSFPAQTNIICCDSLNRPENSACAHFSFWARKFDYIIGNPPYVSFGLNRAGKLTKETSERLRKNYPHSAEYKISYYALFLERAVELAALQGKIGFITPDSFLTGRYFSRIRKFILANCLIEELILLNKPVFAASVGFAVISIFTKTNLPVQSHQLTAKKWDEKQMSYTYRQSYFHQQSYCRFRLFFSKTDHDIIVKMDTAPHILKDFTQIKTGIRSLTTQKDIINPSPKKKNSRRGILSSAEVKSFFLDYRGGLLDVDPAKLNAGGWDKIIIENPKILIRQTGSSLIAALDTEKLYHLNNVHSISLLSSSAIPLEYLLCLLNSKLMNYYYKTISLENRRALAQTDIETLEKLPVAVSAEDIETLSLLAQKLKRGAQISSRLKNTPSLKQSLVSKSTRRLKERLNEIIYRSYALTKAEIRHVENAEKEI